MLKADDFYFKNPGIIFEEQPLEEVISLYDIKIDYLLIFEHPGKETDHIKELSKCAISNGNTEEILKRYRASINEKWRIILKASDTNVTEVSTRGTRSVIGGLAIGLGSVLAMYSMTHYHQSVNKHIEDTIHENTERLDRHIHLFKSVMLRNTEHMLKVDALICDLYYGQKQLSMGRHLNERAELIERVIVKSSSNEIPKDAKILNDLFNICIDAQKLRSSLNSVHDKSLVKKLCHIWSVHKNEAIFKGAVRDLADNIQIKFEINVPILDLMYPLTSKYKITNLGFYTKTEKLKFELSDFAFKFLNRDQFYFSDKLQLNLRHQDYTISDCVTEIFSNGTTQTCIAKNIQSTCIVMPFKNSFLTSFNGTYREHKATKLITYTGSLIVNSGEIFCSDGTYLEMVHRNNNLTYTNLYEWNATLNNLTEFSVWNDSKIPDEIQDALENLSSSSKFVNLVYLALVLNFLLIVAFAILAIKIFGFTDKSDVIIAQPKPEVLDFPRAELKPRPKSEFFGARP